MYFTMNGFGRKRTPPRAISHYFGRTFVNVLAVVSLVLIVLAIWIPAQPNPDYVGNSQVAEAYSLLKGLSTEVEHFYKKNGRLPQVSQLSCVKRGDYVDRLFGANPYYAEMRLDGVYSKIQGGTVGWWYDAQTGSWDKCLLGSIPLKFKPLNCREPARTRH